MPRANREQAEVAHKRALLDEARIKPLVSYVLRLRNQWPGYAIPWFDPTEAGVEARILSLSEAPGPKATEEWGGSGFVSPDNNDRTASNRWALLREAGVDRCHEIVHWNIVPWYLGDGRRIRAPAPSDLRTAQPAIRELLGLLPSLRVILLVGKQAQKSWDDLSTHYPGLTVIRAPHPSPQNLNTRPLEREKILDAFRRARLEAGFTTA